MAKRSERQKPKQDKTKKKAPATNEPWLSKRTGLLVMGLLSLGLAAYFTWRLEPVLGLAEALLWGFGFGVAIWLVFFLAYSFNKWVRRSR